MKKNMGSIDKGLRFAVAIVVAVLVYFKIIEGTLAYVLMGLAGIFVVTSLISFCPLYSIFGLSTCSMKNKE